MVNKILDGDCMLDRAIKVAVWKDGSLFQALWPYFQKLEAQGILEVAYILKEQDGKIAFFPREQMYSGGYSKRDFSAGRYGLLAICRKADTGWYSAKINLEC